MGIDICVNRNEKDIDGVNMSRGTFSACEEILERLGFYMPLFEFDPDDEDYGCTKHFVEDKELGFIRASINSVQEKVDEACMRTVRITPEGELDIEYVPRGKNRDFMNVFYAGFGFGRVISNDEMQDAMFYAYRINELLDLFRKLEAEDTVIISW